MVINIGVFVPTMRIYLATAVFAVFACASNSNLPSAPHSGGRGKEPSCENQPQRVKDFTPLAQPAQRPDQLTEFSLIEPDLQSLTSALKDKAYMDAQLEALVAWRHRRLWIYPAPHGGGECVELKPGKDNSLRLYRSRQKRADGTVVRSWHTLSIGQSLQLQGPVYEQSNGVGGAGGRVETISPRLSSVDNQRAVFAGVELRLRAICEKVMRPYNCQSSGTRMCPDYVLRYSRISLNPDVGFGTPVKSIFGRPKTASEIPCDEPCPRPSPCNQRAEEQNNLLKDRVFYDIKGGNAVTLFQTRRACEQQSAKTKL